MEEEEMEAVLEETIIEDALDSTGSATMGPRSCDAVL